MNADGVSGPPSPSVLVHTLLETPMPPMPFILAGEDGDCLVVGLND